MGDFSNGRTCEPDAGGTSHTPGDFDANSLQLMCIAGKAGDEGDTGANSLPDDSFERRSDAQSAEQSKKRAVLARAAFANEKLLCVLSVIQLKPP